jgi:hypothetical protein
MVVESVPPHYCWYNVFSYPNSLIGQDGVLSSHLYPFSLTKRKRKRKEKEKHKEMPPNYET